MRASAALAYVGARIYSQWCRRVCVAIGEKEVRLGRGNQPAGLCTHALERRWRAKKI